MMKIIFAAIGSMFILVGCAHKNPNTVSSQDAARLNRELVSQSVVFESGTETGAVVPDLSSPRLTAKWIEAYQEGNLYHEAHRAWILDGDVRILGIPKEKRKQP